MSARDVLPDSVEQNKATLLRALERFNEKGDGREAYFEHVADDAVLHGYPPGVEGKDDARVYFGQLWKAFPDMRVTAEDLVADGDRVALRYSWKGTHKGGFMGIPATGRPVAVTGQAILRFRDGKVVEHWQAHDELGMLRQLGAVPLPG
jgi:steroid delta-isomerase-like uncharacterized protein